MPGFDTILLWAASTPKLKLQSRLGRSPDYIDAMVRPEFGLFYPKVENDIEVKDTKISEAEALERFYYSRYEEVI